MTKIPINFVTVLCFDCGAPYLVLENMVGRIHCPYCDHENMYALLYEERTKNNSICDEITRLKRSNAALKGVITKMRGGTTITPVNKVGKDVVDAERYEVDLSDLENYTVLLSDRSHPCIYCDLGDRHLKLCSLLNFHCRNTIGSKSYLKLKPEIKSDLESGKAVAKGGKR